ncbi:MAG TPA: SelB C-terminal domain-containing protein, partial [Terriglobales bacterium]
SQSPIVAASALSGAGLDDLKRELARIASEVQTKDVHAPFRLPIDRVFTMKGFGTVITGTTIAGEVQKEQEVELLPAMRRARVRGVQVHGETSEHAAAGQRTALNLAGVPQEELERGMMLAQPALLLPTTRLDVKLTLLQSARPLKDRAQVHLHLFTTETIAEVVLYGVDELRPGSEAWAQLRMEAPIAAVPGDRFILRQFSPVTTIGGGVVVDVSPMKRVKTDERAAMLEKLADGDDVARLRLLIERREERGLRASQAVHETGWSTQRLQSTGQELTKSRTIQRFGDLFISTTRLESVKRELLAMVEAFHKANPLVAGISKQELLEKSGLEPEIFAGALVAMVEGKKLAVTAEQVHLPGRGVVMKDEEAKSQQEIEAAFATAGLKVPALKEVLAGLKIDRVRAQKIVTLLLRDKVLVKVSEDLVFHAKALAALKQQIAGLKATSPKIDVSRFKDVTGVSRKYAIPLLEYLDRERITRREGDARTIL